MPRKPTICNATRLTLRTSTMASIKPTSSNRSTAAAPSVAPMSLAIKLDPPPSANAARMVGVNIPMPYVEMSCRNHGTEAKIGAPEVTLVEQRGERNLALDARRILLVQRDRKFQQRAGSVRGFFVIAACQMPTHALRQSLARQNDGYGRQHSKSQHDAPRIQRGI